MGFDYSALCQIKTKENYLKEIRIRPQIADNDLGTLVKRTQKWFKKNKRVKISVSFKGRQHRYMDDLGPETVQRFLAMLGNHKLVNATQKKGKKFVAVVDP
jgi:translation initiation factor IF-3